LAYFFLQTQAIEITSANITLGGTIEDRTCLNFDNGPVMKFEYGEYGQWGPCVEEKPEEHICTFTGYQMDPTRSWWYVLSQ